MPLLPAGITAVSFGVVAIGVFAAQSPSPGATAGGALLVGGASAFAAAVLGFVFGFPRSLRLGGEPGAVAEGARSEDTGNGRGYDVGFRGNTNLEQISDWLTKILVGAGLTQLGHAPMALRALSGALRPLLGGTEAAGPFGAALVVYFLPCGFLLGFLWARLRLGSALLQADVEARVIGLERDLSQAAKDAAALAAVTRVLGDMSAAPDEEQLARVLEGASKTVLSQAYYQAENQRSVGADRDRLKRTIPVFRALVALDGEEQFHSNRGSLGFALGDMGDPGAAIEMLTKAIEIRDRRGVRGQRQYEMGRAFFRMELEGERPSTAPAKEAILSDLRAAAPFKHLHAHILKRGAAAKWASLNGVDLGALDASPAEQRSAA